MARIELSRLTIRTEGPLHLGTGFSRGLVDRTIVRGGDGLAFLPASSLKGKVRDACRSLIRLYDELGDCPIPLPASTGSGNHPPDCLLCRLFGAPGRSAGLRWHNARLTPAWQDILRVQGESSERGVFGQTVERTQVQLGRARGIAAEARLFTSELVAPGLCFEAEPAITGYCPLTPMNVVDDEDVYYELVFLLAGIRLVHALGGGNTRGAGRCHLDLTEAILRVDGRKVPIEPQLANVEGLMFYPDESGASQ
jgi:CRISPR/Cas system CSM-associated protein Csm3 (group 7 of RAMP superfamily)